MYPLDRIELPENFLAKYPHQDAIGCGESLRDARLAPFPRSEYSIKVNRQEYFAIITHMDVQIGRILDALDKSGQSDNTYIFFTADHGLAVGRHGLIGKQNMYEHSLRPPFMVVGPDVEAGAQIDTPIYLQDVMPTSLELAGVDLPEQVEFKSLLPLLEDKTVGHYDAIYGAYKENLQRAILKDGYKLVIYPTIDVLRLYNLREDPQEMQDLAKNPEYAPKVQSLMGQFKTLQAELDDPLDLENPGPPDFTVKPHRH
jgi:choline-sulfatase